MEIQKFYKNFRKKVVKSTIFELEQSFKHIFGVAENFWFNGGVKKGGAPPPLAGPETYEKIIETYE